MTTSVPPIVEHVSHEIQAEKLKQEMKIDPSCCRLCFTHADEPIDIFRDAAREFNIADVLAQYFLDQVIRDDALPKVVCHDCWGKIEIFHSFVQRVIAIRENYLQQPLNDCVKEEEVSDEFSVPMDETEIHQENVCVESVSVVSGDPLADEIKLMDTEFEIDMKTDNESYLNRNGSDNHQKNLSRSLKCNICSKAFPLYQIKNTYARHMLAHEKREQNFEANICEICGKAYKTQATLKVHLAIHDQSNNDCQFQCDICNKWFKMKHLLDHHMTRHRSGPQKCDQCDKISPNKKALEMHIRRVHCESKFECHLCDKKFKLKEALKDHIATHKGERNYMCTFCDETFVWRMNMYAHRKKMHKEEWMVEKANKAWKKL